MPPNTSSKLHTMDHDSFFKMPLQENFTNEDVKGN
jgi:hypothetical protein